MEQEKLDIHKLLQQGALEMGDYGGKTPALLWVDNAPTHWASGEVCLRALLPPWLPLGWFLWVEICLSEKKT